MTLRRLIAIGFLSFASCGLAGRALAAPAVSIAAAANFRYALEALNAAFAREAPEVAVTTTFGASGNLVAQIEHGAPFDVFLSADTAYPQTLAARGLGDKASLQTFAVGRLVLWTTRPNLDVADMAAVVGRPDVKRVAIAQPQTAPYGRAAQAALEKAKVWEIVRPKLVIGENISQTAQFVETGNADAGFVALSLVVSSRLADRGHWTEVPPELYATVPLDHACILTARGASNEAARKYLAFLHRAAAQKILEQFGYRVPR